MTNVSLPGDDLSPTVDRDELQRLRLSRDAALSAAQAAVRDATRLTRLMTILNDAESLDTLLDRALATLSELFAADVVVLLDPAGTGSFAPLACIGLPEMLACLPFCSDVDGNVLKTMTECGPLLVGDAEGDDTIEPQLRELDVRSVLYLPVSASHAARGVLILARCRAEPFRFADVGLLTAMAYRIGLAVEQTQRRAQLERIVLAEREINLNLEEVGVARKAVETFPSLVGADTAVLVKLDDAGIITLRVDAGDAGLSPEDLAQLVRCLRDRPEVHNFEAFSATRPASPAGWTACAALEFGPSACGTILALPFGRNRLDGMLVAFRAAPTPFDPGAIPIALLYAGQTAAALENARLYRAVHTELADRRRAERALKASEERLGALIRSVHDLIAVIGSAGDVRFANPAAVRVWGAGGRGDGSARFWRQIHAADRTRLHDLIGELTDARGKTRTCPVRLAHGEAVWRDYDVTVTNLLHEPAVSGMVATFHDVTERRMHERQLEDLAFHDPLTGLANRSRFQDRLRLALIPGDAARPVAVIFFDLDNFKVVNDSLGHEAGDLILKTVAERLRIVVGSDDLGARLGGDEFTILLEHGATPQAARLLVRRLLDAIREPVSIGGRDVVVGASFGIAVGEPGSVTAEELLRKADVAMYHAKASGRNTFAVFNSGLAAAAVSRMEVETDLRGALARGEFEVFFQPIVSLADRRARGAEAFVRWRHPERGLILPDDFIPVAETAGLILDLGRGVIETCFRQSQTWRRSTGRTIPINLNLSPRQLLDEELSEFVLDGAARFGVNPSTITFEITENTLIRSAAAAADVLRRLRGHGFRIAIDRFATGYSSLAYLKTLPVDLLKIDRSFVETIERDPRDRAIVQSVVTLATAFGLSVVAVGVETEAQASILVDLGCGVAQGYLFAPAVPAAEFAAFLPLFSSDASVEVKPRVRRTPT